MERFYQGKILEEIDPKHRGYYKVHIYSSEYHIEETEGIWCKNCVHTYRNTPDSDGQYGQYFPLHKDTKVLIRFAEDDLNTGEIVRILSDEEPVKKFPLSKNPKDRDNLTQMFRTIKHDNTFMINEGEGENTSLPEDSIHLYYHAGKTKIIINKDGIHIFTEDNMNITVNGNVNTYIKGNYKLQVDGTIDIKCAKDISITGKEKLNIKNSKNINVSSNEDFNLNTEKKIKASSKEESFYSSEKNFDIATNKEVKISSPKHILLAAPKIIIGGALVFGSKGISGFMSDQGVRIDTTGPIDLRSSRIDLNKLPPNPNSEIISPTPPSNALQATESQNNKGFNTYNPAVLKLTKKNV